MSRSNTSTPLGLLSLSKKSSAELPERSRRKMDSATSDLGTWLALTSELRKANKANVPLMRFEALPWSCGVYEKGEDSDRNLSVVAWGGTGVAEGQHGQKETT